jgi:hypothetical protein
MPNHSSEIFLLQLMQAHLGLFQIFAQQTSPDLKSMYAAFFNNINLRMDQSTLSSHGLIAIIVNYCGRRFHSIKNLVEASVPEIYPMENCMFFELTEW